MKYQVLNYILLIFHSSLIVFNLFGYLFRVTRKWNLVTLLLTSFSWFGFGYFYGWGYCILTDWHYKILHHLGYLHLPPSYISYLLGKLGIYAEQALVDVFTVSSFFLSLTLSLYINFSKRFK